MSYRLGVDVGGTFTDVFLYNEKSKEIILSKVSTTVHNQAIGIANGIQKVVDIAAISLCQIANFMHGTTAATNAVLENKGVKTAVIVTEGFRDILQIMRQDRPRLYDFFVKRPDPLVPRYLRFEVPERILWTGKVHKPLDEKKLYGIIRELKKNNIEAVAVCLLHSYINPVHEERIRELLGKECPETYVSLSSEVLPEIKEYERMSTTTINAKVSPIIQNYLDNLTERLQETGYTRGINIMQSNAGIMPASVAAKKCVNTILSGPAAGVLGGIVLAKQAGYKNVITIDMGGTSFDICLAHQGKPKITQGCEIGGHALRVPMIDIHTIGAGGGSIAWIDSGGVLKVGPQSAGAEPGPACYKKGGTEPTVTDANLVLGRLNSKYFLGGELDIDKDASVKAIRNKLAKPLKIDFMQAAEGIIKVINTSMVKGIRYVSVERGYDPREFTLVCFGGNGPVHAVEIAEELLIPQVFVPFAPGMNCAYGLLVADFRSDYVQTYIKKVDVGIVDEIEELYKKMENSSRQRMNEEGFERKDIITTRSADIRYVGQGYELEVSIPKGKLTGKVLANIRNAFDRTHKKNYGFSKPEENIEFVNLRISCVALSSKAKLKRQSEGDGNCKRALKGHRPVYMKGRLYKCNIFDKGLLQTGDVVKGPAVIEQKDSTTVLFPGNIARINEFKNIIIKLNNSDV